LEKLILVMGERQIKIPMNELSEQLVPGRSEE
jgi:hypothetical protein